MQVGEGYKGLLARLGRAAGLSALAMGTLASGPCSNCDPNSETTWTLADLRDERDQGLMREGESAEAVATAESWDGVDCPTPEQFNAIQELRESFLAKEDD